MCGFETTEYISCIPDDNGTANIESNTILNRRPEEDAGIGEELLYWKSNLEIDVAKNGSEKFANE